MKKIFALIALTVVFGVQDAGAETLKETYMEGCVEGIREEAPILTVEQGKIICSCMLNELITNPDGDVDEVSSMCMKKNVMVDSL